MSPPALILLSAIGALITYVGTEAFRRFALNTLLLDIPNHRSSHKTPTPSAGGVVFSVVLQALTVALWMNQQLALNELLALIIGGTLLSTFSFIDDSRHLRKRYRFGIQLACTFIALLLLPEPQWPLPLEAPIPSAVRLTFSYSVAAVAILWLINLYNFMDGIDGLAVTEAIAVLASASLLLWANNQPYLLLFCLCLPLFGFALLNFPPAKIFMGDTGSTFLGFTLAALALITSAITSLNLWCWAILLGTFIVDASLTLCTRIATGQAWREAHRSHCYQILARKYSSHKVVTLGNIVIVIIWLLPLAALAQRHPAIGIVITSIAYLPLAIVATRANGGQLEPRP